MYDDPPPPPQNKTKIMTLSFSHLTYSDLPAIELSLKFKTKHRSHVGVSVFQFQFHYLCKLRGAKFGLLGRFLRSWWRSESRSSVRQGEANCRKSWYGPEPRMNCQDSSGQSLSLPDRSRCRRELCHWPESEARAKKCGGEGGVIQKYFCIHL